MTQLRPVALVVAFALAVLTCSVNVAFGDSNSAQVLRVAGTVNILVSGNSVAAVQGETFGLPARVETGSDGSLRIQQPSSTLDIGPNSVVVLPGASGANETIIQNLGRVLYSIKSRKARTFSVQTPYLVSVVKGTVFSVAIEQGATQVALLEGSVELVAEGIESVLLHPNETARRGAGDRAISVTKIDLTPPATATQANASTAASTLASSSAANELFSLGSETLTDLNEIASVVREARATTPVTPPSDPTPTLPSQPTGPDGTPMPDEPSAPVPNEPSTPMPPTPDVDPPQTPEVDPVPTPIPPGNGDNDDDDDDDNDCGRGRCDSEDDHDHGGGNDDKDKNNRRNRN